MVGSFHIIFKIVLQIIREEKHLKNSKHDKKLYQDYDPQASAKLHAAKSIQIK
jgi:hypothetical protein